MGATCSYLHINGLMHRDVKAANLLIDDDGTVLLGDLGVAAPLWDTDDGPVHSTTKKSSIIIGARHTHTHNQHIYTLGHPHNHNTHPHKQRALGKRKSFVGTPCWMAPEVITGKQYDASADIWSFGITALELTQGRAPLSRSAPASVLSHIASSPPPKMDRNAGVHSYSAAFADTISQCLQRDPSKRPTAQDLLNSSFFRGAKKKGYLVGSVLKGLPPLTQRQEKRRVPSLMTHATMDSWDFSIRGDEMFGSPTSPTSTVYSTHSHLRRPRNTLSEERVVELDSEGDPARPPLTAEEETENAAAYARRIRAKHGSASHARSRSVSWASDEGFGGSAQNTQAHPDPIAEVEMLSSSLKSSNSIPPPGPSPTALPDAPSDEKLVAKNAPPPSSSPPRTESDLSDSSHSISTDPSEPVTPPSLVAPPSTALWRKLVGRGEAKGDGLERGEKEPAGNELLRRKAFSGMGALAGKGVGLVRTVSRVGSGEWSHLTRARRTS